jgi:hypothetical protein
MFSPDHVGDERGLGSYAGEGERHKEEDVANYTPVTRLACWKPPSVHRIGSPGIVRD